MDMEVHGDWLVAGLTITAVASQLTVDTFLVDFCRQPANRRHLFGLCKQGDRCTSNVNQKSIYIIISIIARYCSFFKGKDS